MRLIPSHMAPALIEVISDARADFEAWAPLYGYHLGKVTIDGKFDRYFNRETDNAWLGFEAATIQQRNHAASIIRKLLPGATL